jgi:toxin ParE1/3/4
MKFHVSRHARRAIEDIFWTIAADDPVAARRWLLTLDKVIERVEAFPMSGRMVPELGIDELREALHGAYRVIYFCGAERQTLTTVVHGARLLNLGRDVRRPLNEDE